MSLIKLTISALALWLLLAFLAAAVAPARPETFTSSNMSEIRAFRAKCLVGTQEKTIDGVMTITCLEK